MCSTIEAAALPGRAIRGGTPKLSMVSPNDIDTMTLSTAIDATVIGAERVHGHHQPRTAARAPGRRASFPRIAASGSSFMMCGATWKGGVELSRRISLSRRSATRASSPRFAAATICRRRVDAHH